MGIDRIGKGGAPPSGTAEPKGVGPADGGRAFEVRRPADPSASEAPGVPEPAGIAADPANDPARTGVDKSRRVEASGLGPLEQLRAGRIDVDGYVDQKIDAATAHLGGMGETELRELKKILRDQMVSDPALSDLVKQATGSAPTPRED